MAKIVVLGGSGNIGKLVCDKLVKSGHSISVLDSRVPERMAERGISSWYFCKFDKRLYPSKEAYINSVDEKFDLAVNLLPSKYADCGNATMAYANVPIIIDASFAKLDRGDTSKGLFEDTTLVRDCGIAPGTSNLVAAQAHSSINKHLRKNSEIHILVGGNAVDSIKGPLAGYAAKWSIDDILEEYVRPATIICNRQKIKVPACSGYATEDHRGLEGFITDGLRSLADRFNDLGFATERTLRRQGHLDLMMAFSNKSDLRKELITSSKLPDQLDMCIWSRTVNQSRKMVSLNIVCDKEYSAMAKATGYSCCAFVEAALNFKMYQHGLIYPEYFADTKEHYTFILDYLSNNGICFTDKYPFAKPEA